MQTFAHVEQLANGQRQHIGEAHGTLTMVGAPSSPRLPKWAPKKFLDQEREAMGEDTAPSGGPNAEVSEDLIHRYLIAKCYLAHGHFEQISDDQILADVSLLVAQRHMSIGGFAMALQAAQEAAGDGRAE